MRAIVVMFDSLTRAYLPAYAEDAPVDAPNFVRLAKRSVTFDNCYAGSMPCMPARRELHTGRYNFLHRGWGPLEPFDVSAPEMLGVAGIHTHMVTDHKHYWEDGGATYHPRYTTFDLVRGQQGDPWKGVVDRSAIDEESWRVNRTSAWRQDRVNREYMTTRDQHPQVRTFDGAAEFIRTNAHADNWMLHVETFDPHEPFFSLPDLNAKYDNPDYDGPESEWPDYMRDLDDEATSEHIRNRYRALTDLCDQQLGRVLDLMDEHDLWSDTMLIVCTDHGFFLGERGWWGKGVQPWYDEVIHTPLFVWDPLAGRAGERSDAVVQTIDIAPTLLDHFGVEATDTMQGVSISEILREQREAHEYALFGAFGGQVSITDGRYVYMRTCATSDNEPLYEHTLMPTHMRGFFTADELAETDLVEPFSFTRGMPLLRTASRALASPHNFGTLLFDLKADPGQRHPLVDDDLELRLCTALVQVMRASDAPGSQFTRLGLPMTGEIEPEHLACASQPPVDIFMSTTEFVDGALSVHTRVADLLADNQAAAVMRWHLPAAILTGLFPLIAGPISLHRATVALNGRITWDQLRAVADDFAALDSSGQSAYTASR